MPTAGGHLGAALGFACGALQLLPGSVVVGFFGFSDLPVVGFGVQAESMSCFKAATPTDTRIVLNVLLAPTIDP